MLWPCAQGPAAGACVQPHSPGICGFPPGEITVLAEAVHVLGGAKKVLPKSLSLLGGDLLVLY